MRLPHPPTPTVLASVLLLASTAVAQDWAQIFPTTIPTVRNTQSMAYDLARAQILMFGGAKDGSAAGGLQDTWTWNGVDWTQQTPTNVPPTRSWGAMSNDLGRSVVVMFGGRTHAGPSAPPSNVQNDTWEWNGTDWTLINVPNPPAARYGAPMCYDVARGVHVLYSGATGGNVNLDETWEYNGATQTWTQRTPAHTPGARIYAGMAYDQSRARCVLYGGADNSFAVMPSVFWEWDGTDWTSVTPATTPGPVQGHVQVYDQARQRIVIQGGQNSTRQYRIGTWDADGVYTYVYTFETTPAPGSWLANGAYDFLRNRFLVVGGYNTTGQRTITSYERDPGKPGFAQFGAGCTAPFGTPAIGPNTLPVIGTNYSLNISGLPPAGGTVYVLLGFSNRMWGAAPLPYDLALIGLPGCQLCTSVEFSSTVPNMGGTATWNLSIPSNPTLAGLTFYNQVLVNNGGVLGVSNCGAATIN